MNETERAHWLARRAGRLTSSRVYDAISKGARGQYYAERAHLLRDLLGERVSDASVRHYVSPEMLWGLEHEDEALEKYEIETGNFVRKPDPEFMPMWHPRIENLGASWDAFVGDDGVVEVKCPTTRTHINWCMNGVVPDEYKPQMITEVICTRRKWCDFVSYDPRLSKRPLLVLRYVPTAEEIANLEAECEKFLTDLENLFDAFVGKATDETETA